MTEFDISRDVLTEEEAAQVLRVKPDTLRHWRTAKRDKGKAPPFIQQGQGRVLYLRADLTAWLLANRTDPGKETSP